MNAKAIWTSIVRYFRALDYKGIATDALKYVLWGVLMNLLLGAVIVLILGGPAAIPAWVAVCFAPAALLKHLGFAAAAAIVPRLVPQGMKSVLYTQVQALIPRRAQVALSKAVKWVNVKIAPILPQQIKDWAHKQAKGKAVEIVSSERLDENDLKAKYAAIREARKQPFRHGGAA